MRSLGRGSSCSLDDDHVQPLVFAHRSVVADSSEADAESQHKRNCGTIKIEMRRVKAIRFYEERKATAPSSTAAPTFSESLPDVKVRRRP